MQLNAQNPKSKSKSKKAHWSKSHPAKLVADKLQGWTRTKGTSELLWSYCMLMNLWVVTRRKSAETIEQRHPGWWSPYQAADLDVGFSQTPRCNDTWDSRTLSCFFREFLSYLFCLYQWTSNAKFSLSYLFCLYLWTSDMKFLQLLVYFWDLP